VVALNFRVNDSTDGTTVVLFFWAEKPPPQAARTRVAMATIAQRTSTRARTSASVLSVESASNTIASAKNPTQLVPNGRNDALAVPLLVATEKVTVIGDFPSRVTVCMDDEHVLPSGAPLHPRRTVCAKPPEGVSTARNVAVWPAATRPKRGLR